MPLYEFRCEACSHEFEELVFSSSKTIEVCPQCKEKKVKKKVSAGSFKAGGASAAPSMPAPACGPTGG